jgi:phage antirepressor YoqD-like protein
MSDADTTKPERPPLRLDIDDTIPLVVRIRRAAKLLDLSERSIRQFLYDGKLDSVYVGGTRLVTYASIERLLEKGRATVTPV